MSAFAPEGAPDSDGMWEATLALPDQIASGAALTARTVAAGLPPAEGIGAVLALGMGGSGIGNDIVSAVAAPLMGIPVLVGKDYELPAWVGPSTLVVAASFSGNTEETMEATTAALERGRASSP